MSSPRYLTKSRYKLGLECPTKLFYTRKKEYPDAKMDDPFLDALASGGYQVGELAKHYFPGGHDITTLDYVDAEEQTRKLLLQENVVIYEPAIRFNDLFVRIDILVKQGNKVELIEVKAKSFDTSEQDPFWGARGGMNAVWKPYLDDVAFQHYVLSSAYPSFKISGFLMLTDKHSLCATDGLNQKFKITRDNNRKGIKVCDTLSAEDLLHSVMCKINVDREIRYLQTAQYNHRSFVDHINFLADRYKKDIKIPGVIGNHCKKCEFHCTENETMAGFKDGFKECWKQSLKWSDDDFNDPNILQIWNFRKVDNFVEEGRIKLIDLIPDDFGVDDILGSRTAKDRQWLQVVLTREGDTAAYFDRQGFKQEMEKWQYPLHFIDFETSTVALPFTKGRRPYENVAFQFSHHVYYEDGRIEHATQYINAEPGVFSNIDFVRQLKLALQNDEGTIFRYASHENTVLCHILAQIYDTEDEIVDRDELIDFIKSITKSTDNNKEKWIGGRCMLDLQKMVKDFYYHTSMKGSNSIKAVLPAILNSSVFIQNKYQKPIYGMTGGISSLNFQNWQWVQFSENGEVIDPYKLLPKMFNDVSDKNIQLLSEDDDLNNGGAALTAYGKLQFQEISDYERSELKTALLKYCELDTLAMVMIFEAWKSELSK